MILVGRYLSPFVRRVGATLKLYGMDFEHRPYPAFGEHKAQIREWNPVARVPALVLDDGEVVVDSTPILDHLDEQVGPERALIPAAGPERRHVLKRIAVALGAAEKSVLTVYERRFRPEEIRHAPWVDMISDQARDGFAWLDRECAGPYLDGERMTQADVTTVSAYDFVRAANPELFQSFRCPRLDALSERLLAMEAFRETAPET